MPSEEATLPFSGNIPLISGSKWKATSPNKHPTENATKNAIKFLLFPFSPGKIAMVASDNVVTTAIDNRDQVTMEESELLASKYVCSTFIL